MEKKDNYDRFLDVIDNYNKTGKGFDYSQFTTGINKIKDFFFVRTSEERAKQSMKRIVDEKAGSCWDMALGMHYYLTEKITKDNWIVAYSIGLGIPHTFNLLTWSVAYKKGDDNLYKYGLEKNKKKYDIGLYTTIPCLYQIDPLYGGKELFFLDEDPGMRTRDHDNASKKDTWKIMDNRGKDLMRETRWTELNQVIQNRTLELTNERGGKKKYTIYSICDKISFKIIDPFTFW